MQQKQIEQLVATIKQQKHYLIGVSGIPGAGKSTISHQLHQMLLKSIVIPLDGYHLYRKDLDAQGMKFRGSPATFDLKKFQTKLKQVKSRTSFPMTFPSFDHAVKDPVEDSIILTSDIDYVIVEGIYIFDKSLDLQSCWDFKIWIDVDLETAMSRVAKRNYQAGISASLEQSVIRTDYNDRKNALYILDNSSKLNAFTLHT